MVLEIIGFIIDVIGKILLGLAVYLVHTKVGHEGKINRKVVRVIEREKMLAILGIILIILGFLMQLPAKLSGGFV